MKIISSQLTALLLTIIILIICAFISEYSVYSDYHPRIIEIDSQNNGDSLIVLTADTTGRMGPGNALFKTGNRSINEYFESERWDVRLSGFALSKDSNLVILRSNFYADHDEDVMFGDLAYDFSTGQLISDEGEIIKLLRLHGGTGIVKGMDEIQYKDLSFGEWRSYNAMMKDSYTK
jgi:hypothetical protein